MKPTILRFSNLLLGTPTAVVVVGFCVVVEVVVGLRGVYSGGIQRASSLLQMQSAHLQSASVAHGSPNS